MQISNKGIEFIKGWEKFRGAAYLDTANVWTVGYGTTRIYGRKVKPTDTVTEPQALSLLIDHLNANVIPRLNSLLDGVKISQNKFDALCSLCYNIGAPRFANSTLYARIMRPGTPDEKINEAFLMWRKETKGGQLVDSKGLINRRKAEIALFHESENRDSDNNQEPPEYNIESN